MGVGDGRGGEGAHLSLLCVKEPKKMVRAQHGRIARPFHIFFLL